MSNVVWLADAGVDDLELVGGKGANLGELVRAGIAVPPGFIVTTTAYDAVVSGDLRARVLDAARSEPSLAAAIIRPLIVSAPLPDGLDREIRDAYDALVEQGGTDAVAVRSSATAEDLPDASFAGLQDTDLGIRGANAVVDAVRRCWASLWTARAIAYRAKAGIAPEDVALAVVVQSMVDAQASGVAFSVDPSTGRSDHIAIDATWGLGESLVSGRVTPDHLVIERGTGRVLERITATKDLVTVRTETGSEERPLEASLRDAQVLSDADAARLAALVVAAEECFGRPQDIEWVKRGADFVLVQSRPITALADRVGDVPTDWPVPRAKTWYFRASIVEQMPDPLTPLFGDVVGPAVMDTVTAMMEQFAGEGVVRPGEAEFVLVNGYAYLGYAKAAIARITARATPAMQKLNSKDPYKPEVLWPRMHAEYAHAVAEAETADPTTMLASDLVAEAVRLLTEGCRYYTSVQTVIPQAATSELSFRRAYGVLGRPLRVPVEDFLLGLESEPIRADASLWTIAEWARGVPCLADALDRPGVDVRGEAPEGVAASAWEQWRQRFEAHLARYGHTLYNLDFSNPVPADDPSPVVEAVRFYLRPDAASPVERAERLHEKRTAAKAALRRLPLPARHRLETMLGKYELYGPMREDALADVGLAWPRIRRDLREVGRRLVDAGVLDAPDDVFWLTRKEARLSAAALDSSSAAPVIGDLAERKAIWRGQKLARPPQLLPQGGSVRLWERFMPSVGEQSDGDVLKGIGSSGGRVSGPARVIRGASDFASMRPGEILVAEITTPAYTPLFAMASAVVTDVGGPLSHSSIVAREYGIPAVLGTGSATTRIATGDMIVVDGGRGEVLLGRP